LEKGKLYQNYQAWNVFLGEATLVWQSRDPEHDAARKLIELGYVREPGVPMETYVSGKASMVYPCVFRAAGQRVVETSDRPARVMAHTGGKIGKQDASATLVPERTE
jgi:hypothetical protein